MSEQQFKTIIVDLVLTITGIGTGVASTLDTIEQIFRIILLFISICSGILLIAVNWERGAIQIKKWIKK